MCSIILKTYSLFQTKCDRESYTGEVVVIVITAQVRVTTKLENDTLIASV